MKKNSASSKENERFAAAVGGGTRAALGAQVVAQVLSIVSLSVLCRLIAPAEFGVFNTALLIVTLPRMLATVGMMAAAVQRTDLDDDQASALFWINLLSGCVCAVASGVVGHGIAWLSDAPRLSDLCWQLSGTSLIAALGAQHQALLERQLLVRRLVRIRLSAQAIAVVVAIVFAARDAGAGALVAQQYVELTTLAALAWFGERWRPRVRFGRVELRSLLKVGGYYSLAQLTFYIAQNADKLLLFGLLGRTAAGQAALGMYNLAFNLMMKPVYVVTTPVTGVMLPALSRLRGRGEEFGRLALGFYRLTAVVLTPCGVGLMLVADDVTRLQAGPAWREAGLLLGIMAPAIIVQGLVNITGSLLTAADRTRTLFLGALVMAVVQIQGYAAGYWLGGERFDAPWGGTIGVAASYSLVLGLVLAGPYLVMSLAHAGVPLTMLVRTLRPTVLASGAMGMVVWTARELLTAWGVVFPAARLSICVAVGVAVYALLARREITAFRDIGDTSKPGRG